MTDAGRVRRLRDMGLDIGTVARLCGCTRLDVLKALAGYSKRTRRPQSRRRP